MHVSVELGPLGVEMSDVVVSESQREALRLISEDDAFLADFSTHIAVLQLSDDKNFMDKPVWDERDYAQFASRAALLIRRAVESGEWPANKSPEAFFVQYLGSWTVNSCWDLSESGIPELIDVTDEGLANG